MLKIQEGRSRSPNLERKKTQLYKTCRHRTLFSIFRSFLTFLDLSSLTQGNLPATINSTRLNQYLFAMNSQLHAGNENYTLHCPNTCVSLNHLLKSILTPLYGKWYVYRFTPVQPTTYYLYEKRIK
jgi:hypothetical protein